MTTDPPDEASIPTKPVAVSEPSQLRWFERLFLAPRFWVVIVAIAGVGLIGVGVPLLIWRGAFGASDLVALVQALVSWPVAGVAIALILATRFRATIDQLLRRHDVNVTFPGGVGIQSQGLVQPISAAEPKAPALVPASSLLAVTVRDEGKGVESASLAIKRDVDRFLTRTEAVKLIEPEILAIPALTELDEVGKENYLIRLLAMWIHGARCYSVEVDIWGSQISLLNHLNGRYVNGDSLANLKTLFYDPAAAKYPQLFASYSFAQYMSWLEGRTLLTSNASAVKITATGIEYLKWRTDAHRGPKIAG